jgi:cystathionine gamma-lyase
VPIFATSTYAQENSGVHRGYEYARTRNPTREALERCVADLANGASGFAFASGSAAVATILECLDEGSHVIATDDLYSGTLRPMLKLVDLAAIGAIGQRYGIWTGADNTFASPYVQRPLDRGFSVVIQEAGARQRQRAEMLQVPVIGRPILGAVLTHRRHSDPVCQRDAAKGNRLEQTAHRSHRHASVV